MMTTTLCTFRSGAPAYKCSMLIPFANLAWYALDRFFLNQPKLDVPLCTKCFPTLNRLLSFLSIQAKGHLGSFDDTGGGLFFSRPK